MDSDSSMHRLFECYVKWLEITLCCPHVTMITKKLPVQTVYMISWPYTGHTDRDGSLKRMSIMHHESAEKIAQLYASIHKYLCERQQH